MNAPMNEFLSFRKMITPLFIQVIFWLMVGLCVLGGLINMFQGGVNIFVGLVMIVLGPLFIRIYCELLIVLFRIYDELVGIRTGATMGGPRGFPVMPPQGYTMPQDYAPPYAQTPPQPPVGAPQP
jgi:hypothetical protein